MFHKETETRLVGASMKTITVSSGIECAMICTNDNCCSSTHDTNLEQCSLFLECCPDKEFSKGSQTIKKISGLNPPPKDCSELPAESCSGVYVMQPENGPSMTVFCEMGIDNGGWTDDYPYFRRVWNAELFKTIHLPPKGRGRGNDNLHFILRQRSYQVRFDLEDFTGDTAYAVYSTMYVGDESDNYKLNLKGYYGTAGNSMVTAGKISLTGTMFSTRDRDNDLNERSCAIIKGGGWWYRSCSLANINGLYSEKDSNRAVHWKLWRGNTGLKKTMMMIKP
ncbi:Hypothetical predicted protein [Mytilus galloprovincialis]|nr:Hypothetical predicted protein [Mytilus galloprovincialis]